MRKLLYIVMVTACAACAEQVDAPIGEIDGMSPPPVEQEDAEELGRQRTYYADQDASCAQLPNDGSACAHACDQAALEQFIPPGTCATFECPLPDGTVMRVGGCRPAD
jgi:hypothetical protein